jgi:hypothetical protein
MKTGIRDQGSGGSISGQAEAEVTLRLIARLSAPEGIEERVQAGLLSAAAVPAPRARILRWPLFAGLSAGWMQSPLLRAAATVAIVLVVCGGGWIVSSRLPAEQPSARLRSPVTAPSQGGFSSAGAKRTPQTLNGPVVAPQTPEATNATGVHLKPAKKALTQPATPSLP